MPLCEHNQQRLSGKKCPATEHSKPQEDPAHPACRFGTMLHSDGRLPHYLLCSSCYGKFLIVCAVCDSDVAQ